MKYYHPEVKKTKLDIWTYRDGQVWTYRDVTNKYFDLVDVSACF